DTPTTFQWSFGDGTANSTERDPWHQYTLVGEYYVTQMIMDKDGDYAIFTDFILVDEDLLPVANIFANQTILFQEGWIQFISTGPYGNAPPTIFQWNFGDGTGNSSMQTPVHHFTSIGNFTVTSTIEDANGDQDVATVLIQVLVDLVPIAAFTADRPTIIAGETIQFSFTGLDGNAPPQFQWDFGDGTGNSTARDPAHQFVLAGNFTVTLTIEDANGDQNVSTIVIDVLADLFPVSAFISDNTMIISGGVIQFNFTGVDGNAPMQFQWSFGDGTGNSTVCDPAHQFLLAGNFTVILTIDDANGDQDVSTIPIVVLVDLVPVSAFSADQTIIIAGDTIQFTFTGVDGNTPPLFQWSFGDGTANSTARDPVHQFVAGGNFTVTLTVEDANGDRDISSIPIVVLTDSFPVALLTANWTMIIAGDTIQFTFTGVDGNAPVQFQWSFGDGTANSTARDPAHQFMSPGNYSIILSISDLDGDDSCLIRPSLIIVLGASEDTDGDGLTNRDEIDLYGTNPLILDSDGDGASDGDEIVSGSDPLDPESVPQVIDGGLIAVIIACSCTFGLLFVYILHKKQVLRFSRRRKSPDK
nr:PKD domain-containing protein [Candidatus Sigynarchaeota archaeon]